MSEMAQSFSLLSRAQMRGLILCFFAADLALVLIYLGLFLHGNPLGNDNPVLFDLDGEGNIPSWYAAMKLLSVAVCLYFCGRLILMQDRIAGWLILLGAAVFVYLSMDEGAVLHEKIGDRFDTLLTGGGGAANTPFHITGMWMLFLAPPLFVALIAGVVFLRKRLGISTDIFIKAIAGIVIFILAAGPGDIVLNYVTGEAQTIQIAMEEFGEMVGVTLILWAAMSLLAQQQAGVVRGAVAPARTRTYRLAAVPEESHGMRGSPSAPALVSAQRQAP
jgi:hypothetical protein